MNRWRLFVIESSRLQAHRPAEVCGNSQGVDGSGESECTIREGGLQPLQEYCAEAVRERADRQEDLVGRRSSESGRARCRHRE